jgi:hypothetical protein
MAGRRQFAKSSHAENADSTGNSSVFAELASAAFQAERLAVCHASGRHVI